MRANDEHMASGAATIIALLALIEVGVVFFLCGEMGQLTPRGQSKAAEEAVAVGKDHTRQQGVQTAVQVRHVGSSWKS